MPPIGITHIMLLDNLLETGIVQLSKLRQVMHVCNDVAQICLEQFIVFLAWRLGCATLRVVCLLLLSNNIIDFRL